MPSPSQSAAGGRGAWAGCGPLMAGAACAAGQ